MPALNGMAQSSLEQLMKSLVKAPKSVFQSIDKDLLEKVRVISLRVRERELRSIINYTRKKQKQAAKNLLAIANGSSSEISPNEVHVYGFVTCPWYQKALKAYHAVADRQGWKIVEKGHQNRSEYKAWLADADTKKMLSALGDRAAKHVSSPLVIKGGSNFIGGHDDSIKYIKSVTTKTTEEKKVDNEPMIKVDESRVAQVAQAATGDDDDEACAT